MVKKIGKKLSLIICAFAVAMVSVFSAYASAVNVKAEDEYKTFLPQAGSNFRLAQIQTVSYNGLNTITYMYNLVREFWADYDIRVIGSAAWNSFLNYSTRVYVDLIFGYGFGFGYGDEDFATGTTYTMVIDYDYTAGSSSPTATVSMYGDSGIPLLDCSFYQDTSMYDGGVRLDTTNQFPDKNMYLLTMQAYQMINDSGFSNKKFVIPNDYSITETEAGGTYDYRTIMSHVYTFLSFNMQWTTTYTEGGGGGTADINNAYLNGYNSGYNDGLGKSNYLQEENKNLLDRATTAEKNFDTVASENASLKTENSNLQKEKSEFENTLKNAKQGSYDTGFNDGLNMAKNATFTNLIGAVVDVPVNAFLNLFDVTFLGYNMQQFAVSLLSLAFVGLVIRIVIRLL